MIERVAGLAKLGLSDQEKIKFGADLTGMVNFASEISDISCPQGEFVRSETETVREDVPEEFPDPESLLEGRLSNYQGSKYVVVRRSV